MPRQKRTHKTRGAGGEGDWTARFLDALAECPNAKAAARVAGVGRATVYQRREADADFAKAWDSALKLGFESLHEVAWKVAVNGVKEPVLYRGKVVAHTTRYNTALMIYLLRVHGTPEFRLLPEQQRAEPEKKALEMPYVEVQLPAIITTPRLVPQAASVDGNGSALHTQKALSI